MYKTKNPIPFTEIVSNTVREESDTFITYKGFFNPIYTHNTKPLLNAFTVSFDKQTKTYSITTDYFSFSFHHDFIDKLTDLQRLHFINDILLAYRLDNTVLGIEERYRIAEVIMNILKLIHKNS